MGRWRRAFYDLVGGIYVAAIGIAPLDGVDELHAGDDLAEQRVLTVEMPLGANMMKNWLFAVSGVTGARGTQRAARRMRGLAELAGTLGYLLPPSPVPVGSPPGP